MNSGTSALLAILALTVVALPIRVECQQQGVGVRVMPFIPATPATTEVTSNSLPDLIATLRQVQPAADNDRRNALAGITRLGPVAKPAVPYVLPLLTNQNRQLKIGAFFALASIRPDLESVRPAVALLMQPLADEEWTMRAAAIGALFALRPPPPAAAAAVVPLLNDPMEYVRQAAMRSLVAQTNPIVIPMLDKQLYDRDSYVITEAASQIGAFGNAAATSEPRLRELLDAPLLPVRQAASNALAAIAGEPLPHPAHDAKADISFNFPGMVLEQFLDFYEGLAGKKVTIAGRPDRVPPLRVLTTRPLTKSEALQYLEDVLKEQASLARLGGLGLS